MKAPTSTWVGAIVAGGLILSLGLGIRQGFGLFLPPMTAAHGWGRETFSLAIAVQNLTWGLVQPFFGMVADRFGAGRAVMAGALFYGAGLALMPFAETGLALVLCAGLLIGLGLGGRGSASSTGRSGDACPPRDRAARSGRPALLAPWVSS